MTGIRSGISSTRAQTIQPASKKSAESTPAKKAKGAAKKQERKEITPDDRHGAASKAYDNVAARTIKERVVGGIEGATGFGQNHTNRPLRTAPGSPTPSAWNNPGHGVLAQMTIHPPVGKIDLGQSYARCGSACVLAAGIMGGPEVLARILTMTSQSPSEALTPEQRNQLSDLARRARGYKLEYQHLVTAQMLMMRAACKSVPVKDVISQALRPPAYNNLMREQRDQLKVYERLVASPGGLDAEQAATLGLLLGVALQRPVPVIRAWDPNIATPTVVRELRARLAQHGTPEWELVEPEGCTLARGLGLLEGELARVRLPPEGQPVNVLPELFGFLSKGRCIILQCHQTDKRDDREAGHYLMLGRRPDGMAYLYNPDPRNGDYTLLFGRPGKNQAPEFMAAVARYHKRLRQDVDNAPLMYWQVCALP